MDGAAYNPNWKQDRKREERRQRLWRVKTFFLGIFWSVLHFLRINSVVSRFMCRLNIYPKYNLGGRCHWCGEVHGIHWDIKKPNYGGLDILK